jgi:hypothetical protein
MDQRESSARGGVALTLLISSLERAAGAALPLAETTFSATDTAWALARTTCCKISSGLLCRESHEASSELTLPEEGLLIEDALGRRAMGLETSPERESSEAVQSVLRVSHQGFCYSSMYIVVNGLLHGRSSPEELMLPICFLIVLDF